MGRLADLTGNKYDRWLVRDRAPNVGKKTMWLCVCDCGIERAVNAADLVALRSRSCGCLQKDVVSEICLIGLAGRRFGRLSVLRRDAEVRRAAWICVCDCGNECSVQSQYLRGGQTRSCGCLSSETTAAMHRNPEFVEKRLSGIQGHWEFEAFMARMEQEEAEYETTNQTTTTKETEHD